MPLLMSFLVSYKTWSN